MGQWEKEQLIIEEGASVPLKGNNWGDRTKKAE